MSGWSEESALEAGRRLQNEILKLARVPGAVNSPNPLTEAEAKSLTRYAIAKRKSEREIERTCTGILKRDDWRSLKTDPVSDKRRGKGFGELGMADYLYIRYLNPPEWEESEKRRWAEVLWIEWKRHDGKAAEHQKAWHAQERARGALVLVAGEDFPASVEGFHEWYLKSGLCRTR